MNENRKVLFLSIIAVVILILVVVGVTYAYFANQIANSSGVNLTTEVTSQTEVTYNPSKDLELISVEPGEKAEASFNIELTASNMTDDTVKYNINWVINSNNFAYEAEHASDPQLVYSAYYSYDNATWTEYALNQDCTTWSGTKTIASNIELTALKNSSKTVYWRIEVEYKSYDYNQATNMNKSLSGYIDVTGIE